MNKLLFAVILFALTAFPQQRGNGHRIDSFPNLNERQLLTLTNACRMAPAHYRDAHIGNYQVLLPANYPPVRPVYGNVGLNRASRRHAIDMANNCGLQHNSCDGTAWNARIKSFYTESSWIGENIASGNATAIATVKQWVMDGNPPAADLSANDGHRKNIMSADYRELGCGYARGPQRYTYFWVHDFGGGAPDFSSPLVAGCHFFIETGKTTFLVNYFDSLTPPADLRCVIDNQPYPMSLSMGTASRGTYAFVQTKGLSCRRYYFSCTRNGTLFRYPEFGALITAGEGSCEKDYVPPESLAVVSSRNGTGYGSRPRFTYDGKKHLTVSASPGPDYPTGVLLADIQGRVVALCRVSANARSGRAYILLDGVLASGVYAGTVIFHTGKRDAGQIVVP